MANTEKDEILWPLTPGAPPHRLDDPQHVAAALAWVASVRLSLERQRTIEAEARARRVPIT